MNKQGFRWSLIVIASALISYVIVRRRAQIQAALPEALTQPVERIVLPWPAGASVATPAVLDDDDDDAEEPNTESREDDMRRKVSSRSRISFRNIKYGPLPEGLNGEYVDVEARDGQLYVLHQGTPVANFALRDS